MKKYITILMLAAVFLLSACSESKNTQICRVSFYDNASTGYEWIYECDSSINIESEYTSSAAEKSGAAGAGGERVFTLKPSSNGVYNITFKYRSFAHEELPPDIINEYKIEVKDDGVTVLDETSKEWNPSLQDYEEIDVVPMEVVKE